VEIACFGAWYTIDQSLYKFVENKRGQLSLLEGMVWQIIFLVFVFLLPAFTIGLYPPLIRLQLFEIFERAPMDYNIAEARRRRFAESSLSKSRAQEEGGTPKSWLAFVRSCKLYQYPTWTSAAAPLTIAGVLYGTGSWFIGRGAQCNSFLEGCFLFFGPGLKWWGITLFLEFSTRLLWEVASIAWEVVA
jgi:hypothetical protein